MSRKSFFVTLAFVTLAVPAFADVSDGHGGRTVPWKLNQPAPAVAAVHACCNAVALPETRPIAANPAELKALGHLSWVARTGGAAAVSPCYKRVEYRPAVYATPAELKAIGHVELRGAASASITRSCCETGRCPMRPKSVASR